jgi:hypothetical protein
MTQIISRDFLMTTRWEEITRIWQDNRWLYIVAGLLLGILITPAVEQITGDLSSLIGNLVPEAVGIIFTVLILDTLAANRSREELKKRLIHEARSLSNETAIGGINRIRDEKWLTTKDATPILKSQNLENANLRKARLKFADLEKTCLENADLQQANLTRANIQKANLNYANLQEATLNGIYGERANLGVANLRQAALGTANLQGAYLGYTNLQQANLTNANLKQATLYEANLRGANLRKTQFDKDTILPDAKVLGWDEYDNWILGDNSCWTPEIDMTRYTDPNHPDFWQPYYMNPDTDRSKPKWFIEQEE